MVYEYYCIGQCHTTTFVVCEIVTMIIVNLYHHCLVLVLFVKIFVA